MERRDYQWRHIDGSGGGVLRIGATNPEPAGLAGLGLLALGVVWQRRRARATTDTPDR